MSLMIYHVSTVISFISRYYNTMKQEGGREIVVPMCGQGLQYVGMNFSNHEGLTVYNLSLQPLQAKTELQCLTISVGGWDGGACISFPKLSRHCSFSSKHPLYFGGGCPPVFISVHPMLD